MQTNQSTGEKTEDWWGASTKILADSRFKQRLETFTKEEKDNIPESTIQKLKPLLTSEGFTKEKAAKAGDATLCLYNWVVAMDAYHDALLKVNPKKEALARAKEQLAIAEAALEQSMAKLKEAEDHIQQLRDQFDELNQKKDNFMQQQDECKSKLNRAESLINNLSGERGKWEATLKDIIEQEKNLIGDALIASAGVAYCGAFPADYRTKLIRLCVDFLNKNNIPTSPNTSIIQTLQDPV